MEVTGRKKKKGLTTPAVGLYTPLLSTKTKTPWTKKMKKQHPEMIPKAKEYLRLQQILASK